MWATFAKGKGSKRYRSFDFRVLNVGTQADYISCGWHVMANALNVLMWPFSLETREVRGSQCVCVSSPVCQFDPVSAQQADSWRKDMCKRMAEHLENGKEKMAKGVPAKETPIAVVSGVDSLSNGEISIAEVLSEFSSAAITANSSNAEPSSVPLLSTSSSSSSATTASSSSSSSQSRQIRKYVFSKGAVRLCSLCLSPLPSPLRVNGTPPSIASLMSGKLTRRIKTSGLKTSLTTGTSAWSRR